MATRDQALWISHAHSARRGQSESHYATSNDWTQKYPAIANAIAGLRAQDAYLDGELCGVLPDGKTAFNLIQKATNAHQGSLVFFVFDLLFLDGKDIRDPPPWTARLGWRRS